MPDNTTHELHTRLSEKLQRQEELKSVIEKAVCDATGSRQPPLHRVDLTSDRIVKLSKAAELLIANSLSLDGNHKLVGECRSEEHTSELQSLMRTSYAVFCLKKKTQTHY